MKTNWLGLAMLGGAVYVLYQVTKQQQTPMAPVMPASMTSPSGGVVQYSSAIPLPAGGTSISPAPQGVTPPSAQSSPGGTAAILIDPANPQAFLSSVHSDPLALSGLEACACGGGLGYYERYPVRDCIAIRGNDCNARNPFPHGVPPGTTLSGLIGSALVQRALAFGPKYVPSVAPQFVSREPAYGLV